MSGCSSNEFINKGPTWTPPPRGRLREPTSPRITTYVNQNISEATGAAPIIFQVAWQFVFHLDNQAFTTYVITNGVGWTNLLAHASAAIAEHSLTKTAVPNTTKSAAIGSGKINSNRAQQIDCPTVTTRISDNPESKSHQ